MVNPYREAGRAGAKLKFRKMLGTDKGAKHLNDDSVKNPKAKVSSGIEDVKIMGKSPPKRLDRKTGGRVGSKPTIININVGKGGQDAPPVNPLAALGALKPPMPPGPPPPVPPMRPPMPGPGMMPGGAPVMPGPGAGLPLPRKRGGKVIGKKSGGGMTGGPLKPMYGITAAPSTGEGRIQLGKLQRRQKKATSEKPGKVK